MVADTFTRMLDLAAHNGILSGLSPRNYVRNLLSLQYADDTLLLHGIHQNFESFIGLWSQDQLA